MSPLPTVICSGELLLDQGRFQDAIDKFDRAIELEKTKLVGASGFVHIVFLYSSESDRMSSQW